MLEHRANLHRELLLAAAALVQAVAHPLSRVGFDAAGMADNAAMRADRAVFPDDAFEEGMSRFFIAEIGLVQNAHNELA
jgi:hypothetical protein